MKKFKTKKGVALLAILVVALAAAVGGYAYFTSAGSGNGTATSGSNDTSITLTAAGFGNIVPGDGGQSVNFTAANSSATTTGHVDSVSFVSVTSPAGSTDCQNYLAANQGDFSMTTVTGENTAVPAGGAPVALPVDGTLVWANSDTVDQTPCASQPLQLNIATP